MSEASDEPETFIKLTDAIYQIILQSDDENLEKSKVILQNIERRKLYGFVGKALIDANFASEVGHQTVIVGILTVIMIVLYFQIHSKRNEFAAEIYELMTDKPKNFVINDIIVEVSSNN